MTILYRVIKIIVVICFLAVTIQPTVAQQDKTLFLMHELPQANIVNPAVGIKCKYYIGVPLLSSVHFNYSNTLGSVRDVLTAKSGSDSLKFDLQNIVNQTHKTDLISIEQQLTLLEFGYHWNHNYATFSIRENVNIFGTVPQDLIYLAWYGNTHFLGETASLKGLRVNFNHYREYNFGFSTDVNKQWRLGMRMKLLFGKSNIYTNQYNGSLYTDANTFAINTSAAYEVNVSAPINIAKKPDGTVDTISLQDNINWMHYMFNRQNLGLALDFGAIYHFNKQITFSASLLDLGTIFWRSDVHNGSASGSYSYQGQVNGVGNNSHVADSIQGKYKIRTGTNPYFSTLTPRLYLGATYLFAPHFNAGATFYSEILRNKIHPSLGVSINTVGFKIYSASLLWSAQNSTYANIGLGVGAKFGNAHFHITSDNVPAFFALDGTRNINLRFGVNLLFGCNSKKKLPPAALPCPNEQLGNKEFKKDSYKPLNRSKPHR